MIALFVKCFDVVLFLSFCFVLDCLLFVLLDTPLPQWPVKAVGAWLATEEIGLSQYVSVFEAFKVDGTILMQMTG